jgi:hypothetical protein
MPGGLSDCEGELINWITEKRQTVPAIIEGLCATHHGQKNFPSNLYLGQGRRTRRSLHVAAMH